MTSNLLDVLIIGAGPVGLFCANELQRQGLTCRIIDKKTTLSDKSKALGIHIRSLDMLKDCGFIDKVLAQGLKVEGITIKSQGKELVNVCFSELNASYPFLIDLPQDKLEKILYDSLINKGINVEWQTTLTEIKEDNGITSALVQATGFKKETIRCRWLIACDGSHSTVRSLANIAFTGSAYKESWWLADLHINWELPDNRMFAFLSPKGPLACFPIGKKRYRLVMTSDNPNDFETPDFETIQKAFNERSTDPATLSKPIWISAFGISHRQIEHYRHGNIFFAGDAAHVHSPMGGQGLNTGMQDIYNLCWKLAMVKNEHAPDAFLDSYQAERYPIAKAVLKKTGFMTHMILLKNPLLIALRNRMMHFVSHLKKPRQHILTGLAELDISYARSPIVNLLGKKTAFKLGEFLMDFTLVDPQNKRKLGIQTIIQGTEHNLLIFAGTQKQDMAELLETCAFIEKNFADFLKVHLILPVKKRKLLHNNSLFIDEKQALHTALGIKEPTAVLVRPDKYVGMTQCPLEQTTLLQELLAIR